jgi:DNA replication protein DnaC
MILAWISNPADVLLYHGSPGIGKTYFCAALTEWMFRMFSTRRYFREEDLLRRLRAGISAGEGDYLIRLEWLVDDQIVILDDVGSGINPRKVTSRDLEFRREIFFSFLDYRYRRRLPTIITSNFSKEDFLEVYSERIVSRLFSAQNTIIGNFNTSDDKRQQGL